MMLYDLTQTVGNDSPAYPGDPRPSIKPISSLENEGFVTSEMHIGTHVGTHIDAPAHMIAGGKQLKDYPIERFMVPAVCFDIRNGYDAKAVAAQVQPGMGVLFYSGACDYWNDERYWHDFPVIPDDVIDVLIRAKASLVGVDAGSYDQEETFPVHKALLAADVLLIENLTNVAPLVGKQFELIALPLKLENDGAPARVVARLG